MFKSELNPKNYKRISIINCLLLVPLLILLSWPYFYLAQFLAIHSYLVYTGALFFAIPFTITLLQGHITMAIGKAHRHHFYEWLHSKSLSYGLLFHPLMMRTRFRLALLTISGIVLVVGWLTNSGVN